MDAATRGITQFYLDDEPCGIPIDMRLKGTDAGIGWEQVWQFTQDNPGAWWDYDSKEDDPYGYENDKSMHNRGFMKGPDSFASTELMMGQSGGIKGSTRNDPFELRKVLGIFSWTEMSTHEFRFVQMLNGNCHLDYIEFMPTNLIESEDTH